jgi:hypothetical protein
LKKSIFEPDPGAAKQQLLAIPIPEFETVWSSMIVPATTLLAFSFVTGNFQGLIESLFAAMIPAVTPPSSRLSRGGGFGAGPGPIRGMPSSLGSGERQTIVRAGHNRHMIELTYNGLRRLIEPYKLMYYVRKSDEVGSEYFWGYDTTGGKSGKIGIKQFFCNKIQAVNDTGSTFEARYPIDL